jgi:3-polyprenyl-4-hydroxybenzoate decarboxylase
VAPAFYFKPKSIEEIVTQYVSRVLAQSGLPQDKMYRWSGSSRKSES